MHNFCVEYVIFNFNICHCFVLEVIEESVKGSPYLDTIGIKLAERKKFFFVCSFMMIHMNIKGKTVQSPPPEALLRPPCHVEEMSRAPNAM